MRDLLIAAAGLAGFIFEWRRQSRAERREQALECQVAQLQAEVKELQGWRDRMGRAQ